MDRKHWLLLVCVALAAFLDTVDVTAVNVALLSIGSEFEVDTGVTTWVILAYGLVLASSLIAFGRIGDRIGLRRIFLLGFFLFMIASILCAFSTDIYQLIIFRMIQALGGAMLGAADYALVSSNLPNDVKGKAIGIIGVFGALGIAVGPLLGGFITEYLGWRYIFLVNVPIVIIGIVMGLMVLPRSKPKKEEEGEFDVPGALLLFAGLALFIFALNQADEWSWSPLILALFAVSAVIAYVFYLRERNAEHPMLDLSLLRNANFRNGNIASLFFMMAYGGVFVLIPFFMESIGMISTDMIGVYMMALALSLMVVGPLAGAWADNKGCRPLCIVGCIITATALFTWTLFDTTTSTWEYLVVLSMLGAGAGMFISPNNSLILKMTPEGKEGTSSGFMVTLQEMGATLGVVIVETALTSTLNDKGLFNDFIQFTPTRLLQGFEIAFGVACILSVLAILFSWFARDGRTMEL